MTVTVATFRQRHPEFSDPGVERDLDITQLIAAATARLNARRWGTQLDYGISLFIAHHLVLKQRNQVAVAAGGIPGTLTGPQSSNTVDKASVTYDTASVSLTDQGYWGLTSYGLEFLTFMRQVGAGPVQL